MTASLRLVLVWAALMGLLALTIGASFLPLGPVLPVISYAIAAAKAGLVLWFFMELREEGGLARLAGMAGFIWLAFLLTLLAADLTTR
ncbi:hypothetical protein B2G71_04775 [Novosphingobium sp. PC22D]|uniref:cytochrome C oxidase subunit IV family protein n=1 Tax=Novosphingobium sp. PC22D TaxID=1962403 RepID=UPI000BF01367|nr:cytochrome C oxidase subunit IV family protein [Novosphingobium sp. PC22D]PEQ13644.1 hypothetical protein B2G71_04775 [Novosphingobium sp. PC22D]